ncbi:MAG: TlpA family protein disulfide reductase [Candidatus Kerfeldbacteria bacterium]|nr:TlpA family protein disulfide reductase [Candidatus Kerfeldbacteria bacterium]
MKSATIRIATVCGVVAVGAVIWMTWPRAGLAPTVSNQVNSPIANANVRDQDFNRPVPSLSLTGLDGRAVSIDKDSRDPAVILVFWRTDCDRCLDQLEAISRLTQPSGTIYAINVGESEQTVRDYIAAHPQQAKIVLDPSAASAEVFSTSVLPAATFVHAGTIVGFGVGFLTSAQLESKLGSIAALE